VLSFNLSRPARVTVDIIGSSGKVIRRLLNANPMNAGINVAQWDGREQRGRVMPRGPYMIHLSAMDDEGNVCQCTKQVLLR
jgi:flagellar hook assembly protein FlgD